MDQTIDTPRALAEIHFQNEWNLPSASDIHPLRYWAHVHFEDDPTWGKERWTLFIELEKQPESGAQVYLATIFFVAPSAPFHFFRLEQKFELCIGSLVKAHGIIREV